MDTASPFQILLIALLFLLPSCATQPTGRASTKGERKSFWLDVYSGEVAAEQDVLDDLMKARVIYLGEVHSIPRHHAVQLRVVQRLCQAGKSVRLGLEMMEQGAQVMLDHYNRGEIAFDSFVKHTKWNERWTNWQDYRPIIETVHKHGGKIIALNAGAPIVRKVGRQGIKSLTPDERQQLPADMDFSDGGYKQLMLKMLSVHAMMPPEQLESVFQAQVVRDETMAANLVKHLEGDDSVAVVIAGRLHVSYGFGMPKRLKRRLPGVEDRIVLVTESGEMELTPEQRKMARDTELTHQDLRSIQRPIADYLYATEMKP